jgi:hypothetical protein
MLPLNIEKTEYIKSRFFISPNVISIRRFLCYCWCKGVTISKDCLFYQLLLLKKKWIWLVVPAGIAAV